MRINNKKVLITGADGFIGSHLVEGLLDEGADVRAFCFYNSFNSWGWLDTFSKTKLKQIDVVMGDIRDPSGVYKAMEGIDIVFHLAALIGIPFSYHSPDSYVDTNVKGALNILQAGRERKVSKILMTSTSEIYGTAKFTPITEDHPHQAQSPYSATKIAADKIAESFYRSFDMPVTIVRPFNTYGPRQSARAVIPTIITQLLSGKKKIKLGSLRPRRDFVYVKDTVKGFIEIAKSDSAIGEEINIATQTDVSIGDIAKKLADLINPNAVIVQESARLRPEKSEVGRLLGSNKKIKKLTAWNFEYNLNRGLKETVEWFKAHGNAYKADLYNI